MLEHFILGTGADATADKLALNQALVTCAAATEAGSADDYPDLTSILMASQAAGGAAGNIADPATNGNRALMQATGSYLWSCDDNASLCSMDGLVVFPSAMPAAVSPLDIR